MYVNKKVLVLWLFIFSFMYVDVSFSGEPTAYYIDTVNHRKSEATEIKLACDLLGIRFSQHMLGTKNDEAILKTIGNLRNQNVLILSVRALKYLNENNLLSWRKGGGKTNALILDIDQDTDVSDLNRLTHNNFRDFLVLHLQDSTSFVSVSKSEKITRELGGLTHSLDRLGEISVIGFDLNAFTDDRCLIELVTLPGKSGIPIFFKTDSAMGHLFFLASWEKIMANETNELLKIMPYLIFLKDSFGDRCWHGSNDYANLTIDDPWLREPYGYISFEALGREARKNQFHVTIAFIPYNYKKSQEEAIEIFRRYSDNLSIVIHGNNHNFSEFRERTKSESDAPETKSIHPDESNIIQAQFRMDKFSSLTGIPYDRVMVFPRGFFTMENMQHLKKNNFLMTVNSTRPSNSGDWQSASEQFRGITLQHNGFPMVIRYGIPEIDDKKSEESLNAWIQMRLFLDLPVVLYTHMNFFKGGALSFNSIAQKVNNTQPKIIWSNLGNIARHLYLQRKTNENEIEILAYTSELHVKNSYSDAMKYIIKKQEDFLIPIRSVMVNGKDSIYSRHSNFIRIETLIEPGCENIIQILYRSDYQIGSFTYPDVGLITACIRGLSDFRDIYLSKLPWGNKIIFIFYKLGGVKCIPFLILAIAGILLLMFKVYVKCKRRKLRSHP